VTLFGDSLYQSLLERRHGLVCNFDHKTFLYLNMFIVWLSLNHLIKFENLSLFKVSFLKRPLCHVWHFSIKDITFNSNHF
jgi:hypothetical protein